MDEKEHSEEFEELPEPWYKGPIRIILAVFLILMMVLWYFPSQSVKVDPEPGRIPSLDEVLPSDLVVGNKTSTDISEIALFVDPNDPLIKQLATTIASATCDSSRVCHAKAMYYFVRDNINYVRDPINQEYIEEGSRILSSGAGDCESGSVLLASMLESVGIDAELVFITGHAYLRIRLPEAAKGDKLDGDYVYLDWTCSTCSFGEIPWKNIRKEARYLDVS